MIKFDEKNIIFYSEIFFERFLYLIFGLYFFSVIFPAFFLGDYFVVTYDFFEKNFPLLKKKNLEIYIPIDISTKITTLAINTFFFLILLSFIFLIKKEKFNFQFDTKKIYVFYLASSFLLIFFTVISLFFKNQLINSIYTISIMISNICFYLLVKAKNQKIIISLFIFNIFFCVILKGLIIDGGVFNGIFFLLFFILFNNLNKKIIFLSLLILPIIVPTLFIIKFHLMIYKDNFNKLENKINSNKYFFSECLDNPTFQFQQQVIRKILPSGCSKSEAETQFNIQLNLLKNLEFKNIDLNQKIKIYILNKESSKLEEDSIYIKWSKKRNNLIDGSKIENYFLSYYALIINKIAIRLNLNSNFYRVITLHKEFPNVIKFLVGESYKPLKTKFIPRKFINDKPKENYGNIFGKNYGVIHFEDNETTINLGFLLEGYVNYGFKGLIIPYSFLILFLCLIFYLIKTISKNSSKFNDYQLFTLTLFTQLLFFIIIIETNLSLIFGRFLYLNCILIIFLIAEKFLFRKIKNVY